MVNALVALGSSESVPIGGTTRAPISASASAMHVPVAASGWRLVLAACVHAVGLEDEAFGYLERVCAPGWGKRDWVENDPDYDKLHDDRRFAKILAKLK